MRNVALLIASIIETVSTNLFQYLMDEHTIQAVLKKLEIPEAGRIPEHLPKNTVQSPFYLYLFGCLFQDLIYMNNSGIREM